MTDYLYYYKAKLDRVIDGDSIVAMVDLGFHVWKKVTIRLVGIDAPEVRGGTAEEKEAGLAAKAWLEAELAKNNGEFILHSKELDSFSRSLGTLFVSYSVSGGTMTTNINLAMLSAGHAKPYSR